jgi:hypothetical protein
MTSYRARQRRYYAVINPKLIQASILCDKPQPTDSYFVELKEISKRGAKLLVSGLPVLQRECRISLASPQFQGAIVLAVEVHWARPNPAGDWLLGCGIHPPLSDDSFQTLLDSGLLARRSAPREPARILVQVEWQPGTARLPGIVRDISAGGLCLAAPQAPETTNHACIFASEPGNEIRIPVKVRWSRQVGREYFVGCQFIEPTDFAVLRKLQPVARKHFQEPARANEIHAFGPGSP